MKQIILCADDFGLNPGVSQGILKLANLGRLSAVSCMTNCPDFSVYAPELLTLKGQIQMGLHFSLTEGPLLTQPGTPCFGFKKLLIRTQLGFVNAELIAKEFAAQMDRFLEVMGDYPHFIDGHQHVHQLPIIRQVILDYYQKNCREKDIKIRSTYPAVTLPQFGLKAKIMDKTGGEQLNQLLKGYQIPHNACFSGVYDFSPHSDYAALFKQWLHSAQDSTLIMCHPGEGEHPDDVIRFTRGKELAYFLSDEFLKDCETNQVILSASPVS